MNKLLLKVQQLLDIPFTIVFLLLLLCLTLLTAQYYIGLPPVVLGLVIALCVYTLILIVYWLYVLITRRSVKKELELLEVLQRKSQALSISLEINLIASLYYAYTAIHYHSAWFGCMFLFYISLTVARFILLRAFRFEHLSERKQYRLCMQTGYIILAMILATAFMISMIISHTDSISYPGLSIIFAIAHPLYLIITSLAGFIRHRHYRSPLLETIQLLSLPAGLLGLMMMETALMPMITDDAEMIRAITMFTAFVVFGTMTILALYLIFRSRYELKKKKPVSDRKQA